MSVEHERCAGVQGRGHLSHKPPAVLELFADLLSIRAAVDDGLRALEPGATSLRALEPGSDLADPAPLDDDQSRGRRLDEQQHRRTFRGYSAQFPPSCGRYSFLISDQRVASTLVQPPVQSVRSRSVVLGDGSLAPI